MSGRTDMAGERPYTSAHALPRDEQRRFVESARKQHGAFVFQHVHRSDFLVKSAAAPVKSVRNDRVDDFKLPVRSGVDHRRQLFGQSGFSPRFDDLFRRHFENAVHAANASGGVLLQKQLAQKTRLEQQPVVFLVPADIQPRRQNSQIQIDFVNVGRETGGGTDDFVGDGLFRPFDPF